MRKHWKYLKYVVRHKWFVLQYGIRSGVSIWRCLMHDMSKFMAWEWKPYVNYFYGNGRTREDGANEDLNAQWLHDFEVAWNHHQKHNDHHWQYWIRMGDDGTTLVLPMSEQAMLEMLADWRGAGQALGKPDTVAWYQANKHKMTMHGDTRAWIEEILGLFARAC